MLTTRTELAAIAAPSIIGFSSPRAATGIPMAVYKKAQASEKISEQVQSHYGIDVNYLGAVKAPVSAALARAQQTRSDA